MEAVADAPFASSIDPVARRGKRQLTLRVADPRVEKIERLREAKGVTHARLCAGAPVHPTNWYYIRTGEVTAQQATLDRITAFLTQEQPQRAPANVLQSFVLAAERVIVAELENRHDRKALVGAINDKRMQRPELRADRLRLLAVYITAVELEVPNAELGRALGHARQAIKQGRDKIEGLRECDAVDAFLDHVRDVLTGRT